MSTTMIADRAIGGNSTKPADLNHGPEVGETLLEAVGLGVIRDGREVLRGASIRLQAGQWTAIVGPNGAGKSTLLRRLAGLLPGSGDVWLRGHRASELDRRIQARQMSWLGQHEPCPAELPVLDVVRLGRLPHRAWLAPPSAYDEQLVQRVMQETQCWAWRNRLAGHLSGGEQQRVLLARSLAVDAPIMLMDEPLVSLDPPHQADWLASVRRRTGQLAGLGGGLAAQAGDAPGTRRGQNGPSGERAGKPSAVLSVLHELGMALLADQLIVMADGQVVHAGAPSSPETRQALVDVFDRRIELVSVGGRWVALPI